jgi:UDP-N-acetylmuramoyl-L-alanyl-D-glutamate--2,6-diaminopimelate ligase
MTRVRTITLEVVTQRLARAGLLSQRTGEDVAITGITDDSRAVEDGDLFCAWQGVAVDAHDFVAEAVRNGAAAALVEHDVPAAVIPQVVTPDGRRGASVAAATVFGDPQDELRIAGVTGTNGKTTSVWMLRHLLSARYRTASLGTLGVYLEDGSHLPASERLTTPGPVEMMRILRTLVDRGVEAIAMEVSSHALEQGRVHAVSFDVAVFTNLTRDHLDYHGTAEAYLAAKLLMADSIRESGTAVINARVPEWSHIEDRADHVIRFGIGGTADLTASHIIANDHGTRFVCNWRDDVIPVDLPLLGSFNVENALGALGACLALGLDLRASAQRLATVPQVPGRLERIAGSPCTVLRDYAHTPDALERVLQALRPLTPARLIVVFGAGGDRDAGKRPVMGAIAQANADIAIVTSDNPRTEDPDAIIDDIAKGMMGGAFERITNRRAAIAHALGIAKPGDMVLLAGKGHETYQVLGTRKIPFDERVVVEDVLQSMARGVS